MSYARFGSDGSDVYVFASSTGIECCMCALVERRWVPAAREEWPLGGYFEKVDPEAVEEFHSNTAMVEHLERHRAAGHVVPESAFERLRDPQDAADNEAFWAEKQGKSDG